MDASRAVLDSVPVSVLIDNRKSFRSGGGSAPGHHSSQAVYFSQQRPQPTDLTVADSEVSQQLAFNSQKLRVPKEFSPTPLTTTTTPKPTTTSTTSRRPFGPQPRSVVLPPRRRLSFFSFDTLHRHPHHLSPFHHHRPRDLPKNTVSNTLSGNGLDVEDEGSLSSGEADRRVDRIPPPSLKPQQSNTQKLNLKSHDNSHDLTEEHLHSLVDCGGRDLGFCDMNSRYPGHMMGNLMSECQELVYKGFVPIPEDLEELGDNQPLAKYSNQSKSADRAKTGSWSWKPYSFKKKQVCNSELRFIRPGYARDSTGKWQVIVQTEDLPQRVAIDLCHEPHQPCHMMSDCGQKSRCIQRYTFQHLLAVDPHNIHDCPTIRAFKFPAACVCHVEFPEYHSDHTSAEFHSDFF